MKLNIAVFLTCLGLSLEAGEKRSHDGIESSSKMVKMTSTLHGVQDQARQVSIAAQQAAAAPVDETTPPEKDFIKAIERFLKGKVATTERIERLLKKNPSLIATLDKKIELRTFFSELNRSIIHQILGHRLVEPRTQIRYAVDLPLLRTLVSNGLDLKKYPNLINDSLQITTIIPPETLLFLLLNGATMNLMTLMSAINNRRKIGYNDTVIKKMVDSYVVINGKRRCMQELEQTTISLLDKRNDAFLYRAIWLKNFIDGKPVVDGKIEIDKQDLTPLLTRSITNAKNYNLGTKERSEAMTIIRLLLAIGADPRMIDQTHNMDVISFAKSTGEKDIIDIIQASLQPHPACQ